MLSGLAREGSVTLVQCKPYSRLGFRGVSKFLCVQRGLQRLGCVDCRIDVLSGMGRSPDGDNIIGGATVVALPKSNPPRLFALWGIPCGAFPFLREVSQLVEESASKADACGFDSRSRDVGHAHYQIRIILATCAGVII